MRTSDWLKIKTRLQQEFVVGGSTEGKGSPQQLGALLLGAYRNERGLRNPMSRRLRIIGFLVLRKQHRPPQPSQLSRKVDPTFPLVRPIVLAGPSLRPLTSTNYGTAWASTCRS
jgi:hypothetical protein